MYHDHPLFNFAGHDFELRIQDQEYLNSMIEKEANLPSEKQLGFHLLNSEKLERMIDCMEKIAHFFSNLSPDLIVPKFKHYCDHSLSDLPLDLIKEVCSKYWRQERYK